LQEESTAQQQVAEDSNAEKPDSYYIELEKARTKENLKRMAVRTNAVAGTRALCRRRNAQPSAFDGVFPNFSTQADVFMSAVTSPPNSPVQPRVLLTRASRAHR
jgi:hypothetical protein